MVGATGEQTVGVDGYLLAMGDPARDLALPDAPSAKDVQDPQEAISVGASWRIRFLTPEDTKKAMPMYPGFGVRSAQDEELPAHRCQP
jgi:hypothetical protein